MRQPPGRAQRRGGGERKPREERWSELIEVATDVFYAKGYDAASLQDIADRLGMLKGSLYYYIQSKEDLLYDVIKAVHEEGLANIESLAAGEGDPLERLRHVIIGHIEHECRNLTKTAVFLHELQALSPERQAEIVAANVPYVMLCGGEPLVCAHFFEIAELLGNAGVNIKVETNGQRLDATADEGERFMLDLVAGHAELADVADWLEAHCTARPAPDLPSEPTP